MKHLFSIILLFCASLAASAQTITLTNTALEVVTSGASSRTFYDLDQVYYSYKAGKVTVMESTTGSTLFSGDTSEVTISGINTWANKLAKLNVWYQDATHTNGYRYFLPRAGVAYRYRTSTNLITIFDAARKNVLLETSIDSVKISGVTGAANKLTYLRAKAFLEKFRQRQDVGEAATIAAGPAAGTSPTVAILSQGSSGRITVTPGSSTTTNAVICTVTLPVTYPNGTFITLTDGATNSNAVYAVGSAGSFTVNSKGSAITASGSAHIWYYHVVGY